MYFHRLGRGSPDANCVGHCKGAGFILDAMAAAQPQTAARGPERRARIGEPGRRTRPVLSPPFRYQGWISRRDAFSPSTTPRHRIPPDQILLLPESLARPLPSRWPGPCCSRLPPPSPATLSSPDVREISRSVSHYHITIPRGYFCGSAQTPNNTTET